MFLKKLKWMIEMKMTGNLYKEESRPLTAIVKSERNIIQNDTKRVGSVRLIQTM